MKRVIYGTILLLGMSLSVFAELPAGLNGDMEEISETAKGMNKWLMRQIRQGCDFGTGPVAYLPAGWGLNIGIATFYSIDAAEVPEDRPNVHSGNGSMYIAARTATHVQCQACHLTPGKYDLSLWVKGTGTVNVITYNYKDAYHYAGAGKIQLSAKGSNEWTKAETQIEIGHEREGTTYSVPVFLINAGSKLYIDDLSITRITDL